MMDMISYVCIDGIWTMRDSQVLELLNRADEEGSLAAMMNISPMRLLDTLKADLSKEFIVVYHDGDPAALVCIDGICGRRGYLHFLFFKSYWGKPGITIPVAQEVLDVLFRRYRLLIGMVRADNKYSQAFTNRLGVYEHAVVPGYFEDAVTGKPVDGIMYLHQERH